MRTGSFAVAVGAALLLSGSNVAVNAMSGGGGSCHLPRPCAVDLDSLCAGVTPGACLMSHKGDLSTTCSAKLSREMYVATECEADVKRFCGAVRSGGDRLASCIQPHLSEVSNACKGALAYIDAPGDNQ